MFQQTLDGKARAWFDKLPPGSIDNWGNLQEKFLNRFGMLKACTKDPTKISKIVQRENETLPSFKEQWVSESNAIPSVLVLMQISSFMSSHKCPNLSKRFSDNIPKTVDEMLKRVDDYVRSEEAFRNTELPRGEFEWKEGVSQWVPKNDCPQKGFYNQARRMPDHHPSNRPQGGHTLYVAPYRPQQNFPRPREQYRDNQAMLTLDSLVSTPKEILATEHRLNLPQPPPCVGIPSKGNLNRQKGKNGPKRNGPQKGKVINMVNCVAKDRKTKSIMIDEDWMNVPIVFPPKRARDLSKEGIMVEAEVEGRVEKKQTVEPSGEKVKPQEDIGLMEAVLVNPAHPDQLVTIGKNLSIEGATQLKNLLKNNKYIFAWEPSDMTRVPKRIIKHTLNANPSTTPVSQKRRVFSVKKIQVVTQEVAECLKAEIVKPVKYPTWISNLVLVKKSLSGKLDTLNRFLSQSTEKSLLFFKTLKDITMENKDDYRWTGDAENAFQDLKKMILNLLLLRTPQPKEVLYVYLATSKEAISAVLVAERKGRQCPAHYVSRIVTHGIDGKRTWGGQGIIWKGSGGLQVYGSSCGRRVNNTRLLAGNLVGVLFRVTTGQLCIETLWRKSVGPLPEDPGKVKFVIVVVHCFPKWIKAKPLAKITAKEVKKFVWDNIVCRFGLPRIIVKDNDTNFVNYPFKSWCKQLNIQQINIDVAHPQANGLVERENRSLMEGIKTKLGRERKGWVDELPNVLCAFQTSLKISNGETPYSLMFGSEAIIMAEIGMPTHRTMTIKECTLNEEEIRLNPDLKLGPKIGRPILGDGSISEWLLQDGTMAGREVKDNKEKDKIRAKPDKIKSKRKAWKSPKSILTKSKPNQNQESIKFSTHDDEDKEEKSFDPIVQAPSHDEKTDDEDNDKDSHGMNVEGDEMDDEGANEEDDANELYRDVNINF
uniref:Protein NYNRIN-like n=1 Tax=Tanacetum cinerariifolium TaxID=118510 RepID=A0A6L2N4P3_TANCI|nr:protein NYNRIN-like [Tanacetum cinerariifolium]